jgi:excisionase family DNA binding protein
MSVTSSALPHLQPVVNRERRTVVPAPGKTFLTTFEMAKIVDASPDVIRELIRSKKLKATKLGRQYRIPHSELERMLRGE